MLAGWAVVAWLPDESGFPPYGYPRSRVGGAVCFRVLDDTGAEQPVDVARLPDPYPVVQISDDGTHGVITTNMADPRPVAYCDLLLDAHSTLRSPHVWSIGGK